MTFVFGGGFVEVQILIKVELALSLERFGVHLDNILHTH